MVVDAEKRAIYVGRDNKMNDGKREGRSKEQLRVEPFGASDGGAAMTESSVTEIEVPDSYLGFLRLLVFVYTGEPGADICTQRTDD